MIAVILLTKYFSYTQYSIGLGLAPHRIIDIYLVDDLIYIIYSNSSI